MDNIENQNSRELLKQGRKAWNRGNYTAAVAPFREALKLLLSEYGDHLNDNLAEVYLDYGKLILDILDQECEPLGDAVLEDPLSSSTLKAGGSLEAVDGYPINLQVAWEVLHFAKTIYQRQGERGKSKLADILFNLGQIGLRSKTKEGFDMAVKYNEEFLKIETRVFKLLQKMDNIENQNSRELVSQDMTAYSSKNLMDNIENQNSRELVSQGMRAYSLQDFTAAVAAFSKATKLLVTQYGDDLNDNLADVYLYYGKSLLNLSIQKSKVQTSGMEISGDEQVNKGESSQRVQEYPSSSTSKAGGSSEAEEKVSDEDATDLQVAWKVLKLAKKIYKRQGEEGESNASKAFQVQLGILLQCETREHLQELMTTTVTGQNKLNVRRMRHLEKVINVLWTNKADFDLFTAREAKLNIQRKMRVIDLENTKSIDEDK